MKALYQVFDHFFKHSSKTKIPPLPTMSYSILTWSSTCVITNSTGKGRFKITDTKFYILVVTLCTQDNAKLLQHLKSVSKYQSDSKTYAQNRYLNHLVNPSFQRIKKPFVLSSEMKMIEHHIQIIIFQKYK